MNEAQSVKRVDDMKSDMQLCQQTQTDRWKTHYVQHTDDKKLTIDNRRFIIGVILLSLFNTSVQIALYIYG